MRNHPFLVYVNKHDFFGRFEFKIMTLAEFDRCPFAGLVEICIFIPFSAKTKKKSLIAAKSMDLLKMVGISERRKE